MEADKAIKALNLKENSDTFLKLNPDICQRQPDEIGYIFVRRLQLENDLLKEKYIMEALRYFLGYFPSEEQMVAMAKDELLGYIDAHTLKKPLIPGTPYRKVWILEDDKVLLKQRPWDYIGDDKIRFNYHHRIVKVQYDLQTSLEN